MNNKLLDSENLSSIKMIKKKHVGSSKYLRGKLPNPTTDKIKIVNLQFSFPKGGGADIHFSQQNPFVSLSEEAQTAQKL